MDRKGNKKPGKPGKVVLIKHKGQVPGERMLAEIVKVLVFKEGNKKVK